MVKHTHVYVFQWGNYFRGKKQRREGTWWATWPYYPGCKETAAIPWVHLSTQTEVRDNHEGNGVGASSEIQKI